MRVRWVARKRSEKDLVGTGPGPALTRQATPEELAAMKKPRQRNFGSEAYTYRQGQRSLYLHRKKQK